jgi:hypothetical protein
MNQIGVPELILVFWFVLMGLLASVIPFWQISKKAGYSPVLGLLSAIPLVNIVFYYFLAFADWPALTEPQQTKRDGPP